MEICKIEYIVKNEVFTANILASSIDESIRFIHASLGHQCPIRSHEVIASLDYLTPEMGQYICSLYKDIFFAAQKMRDIEAKAANIDRPQIPIPTRDDIDPYDFELTKRENRIARQSKGWGNVTNLFSRKGI